MIVCQCKGTSDAAIRKAVREGATTVGAVGAACSAGTECEGCHETIARIISSELSNIHAAKGNPVSAPAK